MDNFQSITASPEALAAFLGSISSPKKSRSIRFTSAAFPVLGASGVLWRVRKADKRSLAAIRNTKTHISALSTRCSRSGNAEEKCKAHGERERQAATFSIGGWRTGCSPDKWSSTTSY